MFHWSLTGEVVCHVLPLGERPELSTWDHHLRSLTARFGLRCSEALCLTGEHIEINSDEPHIIVAGDTPGNMKSPDKVYFRPQDIKWMENLLKKGYKVLHYLWWLVHFVWTAEAMSNSVGPAAVVLDHWQWEGRLLYVHGSHQRRRKHEHGTCHFEECFKIPETGFIFTSRKGAKRDHLHFQAVYNHIRRQAARWWFPIFFMFTPIIWEVIPSKMKILQKHKISIKQPLGFQRGNWFHGSLKLQGRLVAFFLGTQNRKKGRSGVTKCWSNVG